MAHRQGVPISQEGVFGILVAIFIACSSLHAQSLSDPQWGFSFQVPQGWTYEHDASGAVLGHSTIPGMILVIPHTAASAEELQLAMREGLEEDEMTLYPSGEIKKGKGSTFSAPYTGVVQGQEVRAKGYGTLSPDGGGAYVIALSTPDGFGNELASAADALVRSMKFVKQEAGGAPSSLVGTWVTMTKSTETALTLAANGEFSTGYVAGYSGTESGQWGLAREDHSSGQWTASGSREQGTISLIYGNGKRERIQYKVHVENGEVFWNEYWFNGDLYGRRR